MNAALQDAELVPEHFASHEMKTPWALWNRPTRPKP